MHRVLPCKKRHPENRNQTLISGGTRHAGSPPIAGQPWEGFRCTDDDPLHSARVIRSGTGIELSVCNGSFSQKLGEVFRLRTLLPRQGLSRQLAE